MPRGSVRGRAGFSERRFHAWVARTLPAGRRGPLPLGDDAAAVEVPFGRVAVLTTDAFVEGVHFLPRSPPRWIGAAVAGASLSDLAAKGATPGGLLVDLLVPPRSRPDWARNVTRGAEAMMSRFGAHVIGGDTKPSPVPSVIGTAVGFARRRAMPPRHGARPGDVVVVTGLVGRGGAAVRSLRGRRSPALRALRALLTIEPRVNEGRVLARVAHAMTDTSDGLAESAWLLSEASRVRIVLDAGSIPLFGRRSAPGGPGGSGWTTAFYGGDYELLATVPANRVIALRHAVGRLGTRLTPVGRVDRGHGAVLVDARGSRALPRAGWDPFAVAARRRR